MPQGPSAAAPARGEPPAQRRPSWGTIAAVAGAAGLVTALAVMVGLWAMAEWGKAWLVSELTGQTTSANDYTPFVMGRSPAGALAAALGLTAALNLGRSMAADRRPRSSRSRPS